jgi:hypothetical protein
MRGLRARTWQTDAFAGGDAVSVTATTGARRQTHVTVHEFLSIPVQALAEVGQIAVPVNAVLLTNRHTH